MNTAYSFKRAPFQGALFICLLLLVACTNAIGDGDLVRVKKVIDGDTIVLQNDDTVRFLGVNTPELGHGKFKDEPLANDAREFVAGIIQGREVYIENEKTRRDKYGRRLGQIVTRDGENLQIELLQNGLAFVVAVGEGEFDYVSKYIAAENLAREQNKGIWGVKDFAPVSARSAVDKHQRGYRRVRGAVNRVSRSKKNQTLHLGGDFRVLIPHANWGQYFSGNAQQYVGRVIEVRGWVFKSHGVTGVKIYHPSMLELE